MPAGRRVSALPLHPTSTADEPAREGKRFITDGPLAETREQLGSFFLVDAANLDEAIEIAGQDPSRALGYG